MGNSAFIWKALMKDGSIKKDEDLNFRLLEKEDIVRLYFDGPFQFGVVAETGEFDALGTSGIRLKLGEMELTRPSKDLIEYTDAEGFANIVGFSGPLESESYRFNVGYKWKDEEAGISVELIEFVDIKTQCMGINVWISWNKDEVLPLTIEAAGTSFSVDMNLKKGVGTEEVVYIGNS